MSMLMLSFMLVNEPFDSGEQNLLELLNEISIYIAFLLCISYTELINTVDNSTATKVRMVFAK